MTKKQSLTECLNDWNRHSVLRIEIVYTNGERAGIGNPRGIKAAMDAMKEEIKRQIDEAED